MDLPFESDLLEKLIPWINKPVAEHAMTALTAGMDSDRKALLRETLHKCWKRSPEPIDHRSSHEDVEEIEFCNFTHFVCVSAKLEFERLRKLYDDNFTIGLKAAIDEFVVKQANNRKAQERNVLSGWRIGATEVADFRRRGGERLLVETPVVVTHKDKTYKARTADISKLGCLLCFAPGEGPELTLDDVVEVEYFELSSKYSIAVRAVSYQVVMYNAKAMTRQLALHRVENVPAIVDAEFNQLFRQLLQESKRRNRLDVDNTIKAMKARSQCLAAVTQMNALMVLSHQHDRYHILVTQGQSLNLQAQLLLDQAMIPHIVESTKIGQSQLFYVWANDRNAVYVAAIDTLIKLNLLDEVLGVWRTASWHKAFLVKTEDLDSQSAEQGTSLPCHVAPTVSKLNAPLPDKVAQLSDGLNKISLIEDVSYLVDAMSMGRRNTSRSLRKFNGFRVKRAKGIVRQVPFNPNEMACFDHTFCFNKDCTLSYISKEQQSKFTIVNGYCDYEKAVLFLSLNDSPPAIGAKVSVTWHIDGSMLFLHGIVDEYDELHKTVFLTWHESIPLVKHLFAELSDLEAFLPAFRADITANKLDMAMRNLIITHLPKISIFACARQNTIQLRGLTGARYLPEQFFDNKQRVKLDKLFSKDILKKFAHCHNLMSDMLFVAIKDGQVLERHLLSEFDSYIQWLEPLRKLNRQSTLFIFSVDISPGRDIPDDAIVSVEQKYINHYSPGKAEKLSRDLSFSLSIQLVDITELIQNYITL